MADATLRFKIDGKVYVADFRELNGVEAREFRKAVGSPAHISLNMVTAGNLDPLEYVAGWKWVADRRDDPELRYEDVLVSLNGNSWEFVGDEEDVEEEEPDPTPGASSAPSSPPSPPSTESDRGNSSSSKSQNLTSTSAS